MRNKVVILLLILINNSFINADLLDFYKKGTIKLVSSDDFGKGTDWDSLFFDSNKELVIAPDSSIFVSNSSQHNIFKFKKTGKYVGKFGQKGRGPGDLYRPGKLSILDDKYLVVGEYATTRRINLFDFSGKFIKALKTNHSVFHPIALKDRKVAYLTYKYRQRKEKKSSLIKQTKVIVKDTEIGNEKVVASIDIPDKTIIRTGKRNIVIKLDNYIGDVIISRTIDGNLLVGASNTPEIKIYSVKGELLHSFRLNMTHIPVTNVYIRKFKDYKINSLRGEEGNRGRNARWMAKRLDAISFETLFGEYLPYYYEILVDSRGHILVFKYTNCVGKCSKIFQVYSKEGKYICETKIDEGLFDVEINSRKKNIIFTNKGIYGLFKVKKSEDILLRIIKVDI